MAARGNKVTLQTIADQVGVSRATVSYAFSRPDQLSDALRREILRVAAELGYAGPDAAARSLRLGRAGALGLLFTETLSYAFADPYAIDFIRGLTGAVEDAGVGLLLLPLQGGGGSRAATVRDAVVDGFCMFSLPDGHPAVVEVTRRRLPVVVVDEPYLPGHPFIGIDERTAGAQAARHLLDLGHRRIAAIVTGLYHDGAGGWCGPERRDGAIFQAMRTRILGYRTAAEEAGLDWDRVPIYEVPRNLREQARQAAHEVLRLAPRPTALLANTDILALGAMDAAADLGLRVPADLSIVGFSDSGAEEAGLTTVRQRGPETGELAGRLLLAADPAPPGRTIVPHELVVRRSTAPPSSE
ncbi:LacI family transcriptional regulator [Spongiactinospora gelatinilytica]|uniref:LacI family transcriptional regulator n=1 Tax=Spongiactinospora gelatinilytica TaxID=2666298 RepID=A0A2W2HVJ3_9ACTN|nr:LacI family DNA-binding transcriptional regulator [Spongiactinospora gelatinilytica]PZG55545.1 LacI family transcriptional regulator [Spongiactinospora gelatinilytica]